MKNKVYNKYKIILNDNEIIKSNGEMSSDKDIEIKEELNWLSFHITKELSIKNKTINDVKSIEIVLDFN